MNPAFRIQIIREDNTTPHHKQKKQNIYRAHVGLTPVLGGGSVRRGSFFAVGQEKDESQTYVPSYV
jgi:hypothetical protein